VDDSVVSVLLHVSRSIITSAAPQVVFFAQHTRFSRFLYQFCWRILHHQLAFPGFPAWQPPSCHLPFTVYTANLRGVHKNDIKSLQFWHRLLQHCCFQRFVVLPQTTGQLRACALPLTSPRSGVGSPFSSTARARPPPCQSLPCSRCFPRATPTAPLTKQPLHQPCTTERASPATPG